MTTTTTFTKVTRQTPVNHHLSGFTKTHSEIIKMNNMNRSMYTISPHVKQLCTNKTAETAHLQLASSPNLPLIYSCAK